jgi:hypothetical protein
VALVSNDDPRFILVVLLSLGEEPLHLFAKCLEPVCNNLVISTYGKKEGLRSTEAIIMVLQYKREQICRVSKHHMIKSGERNGKGEWGKVAKEWNRKEWLHLHIGPNAYKKTHTQRHNACRPSTRWSRTCNCVENHCCQVLLDRRIVNDWGFVNMDLVVSSSEPP